MESIKNVFKALNLYFWFQFLEMLLFAKPSTKYLFPIRMCLIPLVDEARHKGPKHCGILSESSVVVMETTVKQKPACGTLAQGFQHYHNNPVVTVRN